MNRISAVPETIKYPRTADDLRDIARIASLALGNAVDHLYQHGGEEDALDIIRKKWEEVLNTWTWMVDVYCHVESAKEWKRKRQVAA